MVGNLRFCRRGGYQNSYHVDSGFFDAAKIHFHEYLASFNLLLCLCDVGFIGTDKTSANKNQQDAQSKYTRSVFVFRSVELRGAFLGNKVVWKRNIYVECRLCRICFGKIFVYVNRCTCYQRYSPKMQGKIFGIMSNFDFCPSIFSLVLLIYRI